MRYGKKKRSLRLLIPDSLRQRQSRQVLFCHPAVGLDSLALMEFVFAVEDRFDVRIPEERLDPRQAGVTLEQLALLIDEAVAVRPGSDAAAA